MTRQPITDSDSPEYIGVAIADSCSAELCGVVWPITFALQRPGIAVTIAYDATFACHSAEAIANPHQHVTLVHLAAGLPKLLTNVSSLKWLHVPSHQGDPWNEHVDALCDLSAKCVFSTALCRFPGLCWLQTNITWAALAFLLRPTEAQRASYPLHAGDSSTLLVSGPSSVATHGIDSATIAGTIDRFREAVPNAKDKDAAPVVAPELLKLLQRNPQTSRSLVKRGRFPTYGEG